jgi:hypothetical protein
MSILATPAGENTPRADGATLAEFGYRSELRRSLSLGDLLVYGLVFIVPIAPFSIFGIVFSASKGMVPLTYLIGLVAMMFGAELSRNVTRISDCRLRVRLRRPRHFANGRFSGRVGDSS